MANTFDPYAEWLGIPIGKRPLTSYSLLGVTLYEPRADVIQRAAAQRIAQLQSVVNSPHAEIAKKIIAQVEAARACLLNSESKQRYDAQLRKIAPAPHVTTQPLPPPVSSAPPQSNTEVDFKLLDSLVAEQDTVTTIAKKKKRSGVQAEAMIQRGTSIVLFVGVLLIALFLGLLAGRNAALVVAELPIWHESPDEVKRVAMSEPRRKLGTRSEDDIDHMSVKYMSMFAAGSLASVIVGGYYLMRY
ncbi:MAG TPA: hypothetical protein VGG64_03085 [Pirellulales bacterium]|jgi:hypothetical protein